MKSRILLIATVVFFLLVGSFIISYAQELSDRAPSAPSPGPTITGSAAQPIPPAPSAELLRELAETKKKISLVNAIIVAEVKTKGKAISAKIVQKEDKTIIYMVMIAKKPFSIEVIEVDAIKGNIIN